MDVAASLAPLGNGFMKRQCFTIVTALLITPALLIESGSAVEFYSLRAKAKTKRCLPNHAYGDSAPPFTLPRGAISKVIAVAATDPTEVGKQRKTFHFRALAMQADQLRLDQVGLALYGAKGQLFASGRLSCGPGDGGIIGGHAVIRLRAYVSYTTAAAPKKRNGSR